MRNEISKSYGDMRLGSFSRQTLPRSANFIKLTWAPRSAAQLRRPSSAVRGGSRCETFGAGAALVALASRLEVRGTKNAIAATAASTGSACTAFEYFLTVAILLCAGIASQREPFTMHFGQRCNTFPF